MTLRSSSLQLWTNGTTASIKVYRFDADEVRRRFDAARAARIQAGRIVQDNFGMWVNLDADDSAGAGLGAENAPLATYPLEELIGENSAEADGIRTGSDEDITAEPEASSAALHTIAEVMDWARKRIATLSGGGHGSSEAGLPNRDIRLVPGHRAGFRQSLPGGRTSCGQDHRLSGAALAAPSDPRWSTQPVCMESR